MGYVRAPGFVPGIVVGVVGVWAFHRFVRPMKGKGQG
jgi:hypothetical protein